VRALAGVLLKFAGVDHYFLRNVDWVSAGHHPPQVEHVIAAYNKVPPGDDASTITARIAGALLLFSLMEGVFSLAAMTFFVRATGSIAGADFLDSAFWLSMMAFEIPTGYLADRLGPKTALLGSIIFRASALALYFVNPGPIAILIVANVLEGFGLTVSTGTFTTQLKLEAEARGVELDAGTVSGQLSTVRFGAFLGGGVLGTIAMALLGLRALWPIAICVCIALFVAICLTWRNVRGASNAKPHLHLRSALQKIRSAPRLLRALILNAVVLALTLSLLQNWIVVFVPRLDKTPLLLGLGTIIVAAVRTLSGFLYQKFAFLKRGGIGTPLAVLGGATILAGIVPFIPATLSFVLSVGAVTITGILIGALVFEHLPANEGATVMSISSLLENCAGGIMLLILSEALKHATVQFSWIICGAALLLAAVLWVIQERRAVVFASVGEA
jgi:MFS family permease